MTLSPGAQLGPYEIVAPLGAGGMGEVYRARDPRIGREVAIKVLPAALATDADRLRRFELEVRAVGALNHPNILTIFDVGTHDGAPYIVSELLEGETLRDRVAGGPLVPRRAIDHALQTTSGLAAAHQKGIIHRDLKPENIFITRDGRVKILDFGLAKLADRGAPSGDPESAPTVAASPTEPGMVLGTVGYMSPEQVRGDPADQRSDLFSFGAILYEMLSGQRAFRRGSAVESMHAILRDDPPDLLEVNPQLSPALGRLVRRCMEKDPQARFQTASDLGFALEGLSGLTGHTVALPAIAPEKKGRRRLVLALLLLALAVSYVVVFLWARTGSARDSQPVYHRLTFRRGLLLSARLAPDGQTVVYGAAWEGEPVQIFSTRLGSTESRPLGLPSAEILSISQSGEMAILLGGRGLGTLARAPLAGGVPREILENVRAADWAPDGANLAAVHVVQGRHRLEFPIGKTLYETTGTIWTIRFSPKGDRIPMQEAGAGRNWIATIGLDGKKTMLADGYVEGVGLAWSPRGDEVWFSLTDATSPPAIRAVTLAGNVRLVERAPTSLILGDIGRDGRVLLANLTWRAGILCLAPGESQERRLDWLDWSIAADLSRDGRNLLFSETRHGGGASASVYLRRTDGAPPVRLGEGRGHALSPDGKWALSSARAFPRELVLLPTGAGQSRTLTMGGLTISWAKWFPDGNRVLVSGSEPDHRGRLCVQELEGGKPRVLTPEGVNAGDAISPDGKLVAVAGPDRKIHLYPAEGGEPRPGPALEPGEVPIQWSADGRSLFLRASAGLPARVYRLDLTTGRKKIWKEFRPPDSAGVFALSPILVTPDGRSYAYTYQQQLTDLFLVEGLR